MIWKNFILIQIDNPSNSSWRTYPDILGKTTQKLKTDFKRQILSFVNIIDCQYIARKAFLLGVRPNMRINRSKKFE